MDTLYISSRLRLMRNVIDRPVTDTNMIDSIFARIFGQNFDMLLQLRKHKVMDTVMLANKVHCHCQSLQPVTQNYAFCLVFLQRATMLALQALY